MRIYLCKQKHEKVLARELTLLTKANKPKLSKRAAAQSNKADTETPGIEILESGVVRADDPGRAAQKRQRKTEKLPAYASEQLVNASICPPGSLNSWLQILAEIEPTKRLERACISSDNNQNKNRLKNIKKNLTQRHGTQWVDTPNELLQGSKNMGLRIHLGNSGAMYIGDTVLKTGIQRMRMDELAPSRAYLKLEEAFWLLHQRPQRNELVIDLGGAPGGWSYSAVQHGAKVIAVDNGPLKGGAKNHPLIEHRREDAFKFRPLRGQRVDWMLCDMIVPPEQTLELLANWIERRWCYHFVVTVKTGRNDPVQLIQSLGDRDSVFGYRTQNMQIRHFWHNREEFTVMGDVRM